MKTALWYSLRSSDILTSFHSVLGLFFDDCFRGFRKAKEECIRFAHRAIFVASLGLGANIMWSLCSVNPIFKRKGAIVIRERAGKNFDSVQSLVDTRSVNFIRVFYCAFLVEWMHQ